MSIKKLRRNIVYGINNPLQEIAPLVIESTRAPTTSDAAQIGTTWVNKTTASVYVLAKAAAGSYTWSTSPGSGVGTFTSLTVSTGGLTFAGGATGDILMPTGDLTLTAGNAVIGGDLTVAGTLSFTGDFDMTTADVFDITATGNQDPAISLTANGGTSETIHISATQGTAADSVELSSTDGGINIATTNSTSATSIRLNAVSGGILSSSALLNSMTSTRATADAINISTTQGGIDITATGTAGLDLDITASGSSVNISATENAIDAVTIIATTGGIDISASGAAAGEDIDIEATGSSVNLLATESVIDAITIEASGAAGGVEIKAGTSGIAIGNEADTSAIDIGDFAPTSSRFITIGGGQVATAAVTDTIDIAPDGATANANSIKVVNIATGALDTGENNINIGSGNVASGTHAISISTGTGTKTVSLGNADGGTTTAVVGPVNVNVSQNNDTAINSGTSTGTVTVGNGSAGAITIDTAAGISIDAATASNLTVTGASADLTLGATGGSINIVATEAAADAIVINASNAAGGIQLTAGSNGSLVIADSGDVTLQTTTSGDIHLSSVDNNVIWTFDEQTNAGAAVTSNTHNGQGVFTGLTTAAAASQVFTITNSVIGIATPLFITACNAGANDAQMTITRVKKLSGSVEVTLTNNGVAALNGDVNITWLIYAT